MKCRMGILAFFKKISRLRSPVFFHAALCCSGRQEQQGSWHSLLPRECAGVKKIPRWHCARRAVLFHSFLQPATRNMCQRTFWGGGEEEGKDMPRVNPRVQEGFVSDLSVTQSSLETAPSGDVKSKGKWESQRTSASTGSGKSSAVKHSS